MKKSEQYKMAMAAVILEDSLDMDETLEILETLMDDKRSAEWSEKWEAEKNADLS